MGPPGCPVPRVVPLEAPAPGVRGLSGGGRIASRLRDGSCPLGHGRLNRGSALFLPPLPRPGRVSLRGRWQCARGSFPLRLRPGVTVSGVSPCPGCHRCVCVCVPVHGTGMLGSVDERGAVRAGWYVCMGVQEGWGLCVRGCCVCVHGRARKHECAWVCEGPGGWGCVQGGMGVRGCQRVHGCARGPACARGGWCAHGRGREPV